MAKRDAFWDAKNALMQKPDGDGTEYCPECHGEGCRDCRGWGWRSVAGACDLPATGHACKPCTKRPGCPK
jgi:hypothetical protein